jgi:DNA-binding transcriptional LysR family regulator
MIIPVAGDDNNLQDIRAFVEVARHGSFVRASEALRQSNSAISKAVTRLEKSLDVRLFKRSTRHLLLTEEGRSYFGSCERILSELERAQDEVRGGTRAPRGSLRLHFPLLWAREVIMPAVPDFIRRYPNITLQLIFSEIIVDQHSGFDISVQLQLVQDKQYLQRPLIPTRSIIAASPEYLRRAGTPTHPDELAQHVCLRFMLADRNRPTPWHFTMNDAVEQRTMQGRVDVSDPQAMVAGALAGTGLIQAPDILLREYLASGRLRQVLPKWECDGPTISMVWSRDRYLSSRMRVCIDWLSELAAHYRKRYHLSAPR